MRLCYVEYEMGNMNFWLVGWLDIGMRLLCMINLWLVGETWLWYELDVIP